MVWSMEVETPSISHFFSLVIAIVRILATADGTKKQNLRKAASLIAKAATWYSGWWAFHKRMPDCDWETWMAREASKTLAPLPIFCDDADEEVHDCNALCDWTMLSGSPALDAQTAGKTTLTTTTFVLNRLEELPEGHYLRDNEYILGGYRVRFSHWLSFWSLFRWHNETLNAWSHLVGAVTAVFFGWDEIMNHHNTGWDWWLLLIYQVIVVHCMVSSCLYHTGRCCGGYAERALLRCDLLGVSLMIGGASWTWTYYATSSSCAPAMLAWKKPYALAGLLFLTMGASAPLGGFRSLLGTSHMLRVQFYVAWVLLTIVPVFHLAYVFPSQVPLQDMMWCWFVYGLGLLFYATKWPECVWPGKFDFVGASHTWWHMGVFGGAIMHMRATFRLKETMGMCSA